MKAFISYSAIVPAWVLWAITAIAVVAAGIGPLASWVRSKRIARGALVSVALFAIFVPIIVDCWGLPDWLCYLIP